MFHLHPVDVSECEQVIKTNHQHLEDDHCGGTGGGNTHRNGGSDHKVNVEKLCVSKICFVAVQDETVKTKNITEKISFDSQ